MICLEAHGLKDMILLMLPIAANLAVTKSLYREFSDQIPANIVMKYLVSV
jgi:hypothetical protein